MTNEPTGGPTGPVSVHIIPHTHWDREWYEPFESFRMRLIPVVDELLEILGAEPSYRFTLDGQTAVIDDYLEIRPDREAELRTWAESGRVSIGPWTTLADEFLVSGETLWRNIELGLERSRELAQPMPVGYLPDMFGHTAQMPQILARFGFDRAVLWRGVPNKIDRTLFRWRALDGSEVIVGYLCNSYSNGVALPTDPHALAERCRALIDEQQPFAPGGDVLVMCGTDHWRPQAGLTAAAAAVNATESDLDLRITDLPTYFDAVDAATRAHDVPVATGELRSGARSNVLMGVTSTRVDLKRLQARAERTLERYAEPLDVIARRAQDPTHAALARRAWAALVLNAAHDSVCSCSSDDAMRAVENRYREALTIAEGLSAACLARLADRIKDPRVNREKPGIVVWNPSPHTRSEIIEVDVETDGGASPIVLETTDGKPLTTVELGRAPTTLFDVVLSADQMMGVVPLVRSREFEDVAINAVDVDDSDEVIRVRLHGDPGLRRNLDVEAVKARIVDLARSRPNARFRVEILRPPTARVLVRTSEIAALGWTTLSPVNEAAAADAPGIAGVEDGIIVLDNGLIRVEIAGNGTFAMENLETGVRSEALGSITDGGDAGDTYNYSPPDSDALIDVCADAEATIVESTALRGRVLTTRRMRIPVGLVDGSSRSGELVELVVTTRITVDAASAIADVGITFDNAARDHRLRVHFPLPEPAVASHADVAFGVVARGLETEGSDQEPALPTWPAKRFVDAGGLGVLCDQTIEYELVDSGREVAITLVRATGYLSRPAPRMRPNAAGPILAVEHAQCLGPQELHLGLLIHDGDWRTGHLVEAADDFAHPFAVLETTSSEQADLAPSGHLLELDLGDTAMLSALRRTPEGAEIRVVNCASAPSDATVSAADLALRTGAVPDDGETAWSCTLEPWQIATFAIPMRARIRT